MELKGGELKVTTSDLETTIVGVIKVDNVEKEGMVAAPSKLMLDVLKECSEMPLCLEVNPDNWEIQISWRSGKSVVPGANPVSYPQTHELSENKTELSLDVDILVNGINKTIFATADDELRPVMNGVYFNFDDSAITCVATDAHKLVKHTVEAASGVKSAFILPKKPANLLKNLLLKEEGEVKMTFDEKNVVFSLSSSTLVCRLIEGTYPNYTVVIPQANPNKMLVDRIELLNAIKRVAVCSNSTTNLIRLDISNNKAILDGVIENGGNLAIVAKYGSTIPPVSVSQMNIGDSVIDTVNTSFGATCAKADSTLGENYVQAVDCGHNHISPDNMIDASTAAYPEYTWFIKDLMHADHTAAQWELIRFIFESEKQPTVTDSETYPQFLISLEDESIVPHTAENDTGKYGNSTEKGETLFEKIANIIKSIFNTIKAFFIDMF
jgi:DNA polymerase III beta subunit